MAINLSFPKPRATQTKIFAVARTDSSTEKCWLPKDAVIVGVYVLQTTAAATAAATFDVIQLAVLLLELWLVLN
jgi:hypothetical protein